MAEMSKRRHLAVPVEWLGAGHEFCGVGPESEEAPVTRVNKAGSDRTHLNMLQRHAREIPTALTAGSPSHRRLYRQYKLQLYCRDQQRFNVWAHERALAKKSDF